MPKRQSALFFDSLPGTRRGRAFSRSWHPPCRLAGRTHDLQQRTEVSSDVVATTHPQVLGVALKPAIPLRHHPTAFPRCPHTLPKQTLRVFVPGHGQHRLDCCCCCVFVGPNLLRHVLLPPQRQAHHPQAALIFAAVATANSQKVSLPPPRKTLFLARKQPAVGCVHKSREMHEAGVVTALQRTAGGMTTFRVGMVQYGMSSKRRCACVHV